MRGGIFRSTFSDGAGFSLANVPLDVVKIHAKTTYAELEREVTLTGDTVIDMVLATSTYFPGASLTNSGLPLGNRRDYADRWDLDHHPRCKRSASVPAAVRRHWTVHWHGELDAALHHSHPGDSRVGPCRSPAASEGTETVTLSLVR
jgi:hypothetical protein